MTEDVVRRSWTYKDLVAAGKDPALYEIADGEPVEVKPVGFLDGIVFAVVAKLIGEYLDQRPVGVAVVEGRFLLRKEPRLERRPDVAVVLAQRVPEPIPVEIFPGAPDLAVEIVSPTDTTADARSRAQGYLDAGSREVWIVDPALETVSVLRPGEPTRPLGSGSTLETALLPGLSLRVAELFLHARGKRTPT